MAFIFNFRSGVMDKGYHEKLIQSPDSEQYSKFIERDKN